MDSTPMTTPVTQSLMFEALDIVSKNIEAGHDRLRETITELKIDMNAGFNRLAEQQKQTDEKIAKHTERLVAIETVKNLEKEQSAKRDNWVRGAVFSSAALWIFEGIRTFFAGK